MADYDVQALSLASPPASAPVTTYYPGVRVRNNGIHPADVSGWVRVYDAATGLLIATFDVAKASLAAGTEGTAVSTQPWTPTVADIGKHFLWNGYVTTDNDQVPSNNPLAPVDIVVTGEVPPPPVVTAHATQHEAGGTDELNVAGLPGQLADNQHPLDHASNHQNGGDDRIDVTDLPGILAEGQTPKIHANEAHSVAYATGSEVAGAIGIHDAETTAHDAAANLEKTDRKNVPTGYAGLNLDGYVQYPQLDMRWEPSYNNPMRLGSPGDYELLVDRVAGAGHQHRTTGGVAAARELSVAGGIAVLLSRAYQAGLWLSDQCWLRLVIAMEVELSASSALTYQLVFTPSGGPAYILANHTDNYGPPQPAGTIIRFVSDVVLTGHANTSPGATAVSVSKTKPPGGGLVTEGMSIYTSGTFPTNQDASLHVGITTSGSVTGFVKLARLDYVGDKQPRLG